MHPFGSENIDGSGKRRRYRRNENREAAVVQFFNNECGNKCLLNFGQGRLPCALLVFPGYALRQAPKQCVTWDSFEKRFLDTLSDCSPCRRANGNTDEKTHDQHEKQRECVFSREPCRDQHGQGPHKAHNRLHRLEQQQNGEINRHDDEQARKERAPREFTELFH